ncbi:MAG TPA: hypothetical protein VNN73_17505 [Blastocatellia bacterium]|nr:hypothetical protein [Blastocatellia bacterium]
MADFAVVYQGAQIGLEATQGTSVPANKVIQSIGIGQIKPKGQGELFRPQSSKIATIVIPPGDEMCEADAESWLTYNESVYLFCAAIKNVTPTTPTSGVLTRDWTFDFSKNAADTVKTYTVEVGNADRAQKFTFGHFNGFQLDMSRKTAKFTSTLMGQRLQDDIVITPSPTSLSPTLVIPYKFDVYLADTQVGLDGASAFSRAFKANLTVGPRFDYVWRMASGDTSFVNYVELPLQASLKLTLGSDDAEMGPLTKLRNGSKQFIRLKALGADIETVAGPLTYTETFQLDFSGALVQPYESGEENGLVTRTWTFENIYDSTWGKSLEILLRNTVSAL